MNHTNATGPMEAPARRRRPAAHWRRSLRRRTRPAAHPERWRGCAPARNRHRSTPRCRDTRPCTVHSGNHCARLVCSGWEAPAGLAVPQLLRARSGPVDRRRPDPPSAPAGQPGPGRPSAPGRSRQARMPQKPTPVGPRESVAGSSLLHPLHSSAWAGPGAAAHEIPGEYEIVSRVQPDGRPLAACGSPEPAKVRYRNDKKPVWPGAPEHNAHGFYLPAGSRAEVMR
jgi:hypothetical protein